MVELRVPGTADLLEAWERGLQDESRRAEELCDVLTEGAPLGTLSLGRRNRLLLAARVMLFGPTAEVVADCDVCGARLEALVAMADVVGPGAIGGSSDRGTERDGDAEPDEPAVVDLRSQGYDVRMRVPTGQDLAGLPDDLDEAARELLARCVLAAEHRGRPIDPMRLPAAVVGRLESAAAAADPDAVIEVRLVCPDCEHAQELVLDPVEFVWAELDRWAWRLLGDVHQLAATYGWCERDILAMSPVRRQTYLQLSGAAT